MINLPKLHLFDKEKNHILIIDDLVTDKEQDNISNYFIMGRKKNVSVLYLSQKFYLIPKIIRDNSTLLVLLKIDNEKDKKKILNEFSHDLPIKTFLNAFNYATEDKLDAFIIDKESNDEWKYRRNLNEALDMKNFI